MGNLIITIGREFGSAGKNVGLSLSEHLNIPCYDKELLERAAKESEFCEEIFEHHDEKPTSSFLYSLVMDANALGTYTTAPGLLDMPLNQKVFLAQFDTIKKIADNESCVMIGRCADYALADYDNVVRVFIRADEEFKLKRLMDRFKCDEKTARDLMKKTDKKRASYYDYYTSKKWGDSSSYDLCLNTSDLGVEGAVNVIMNYIEVKKRHGLGEI
ncbi:MAG: cytidylate kinase-like family protein [Lachnospiraceae bacterium]|nr:cytidylate kinase-like family protein [Lachnospiraceae bacterium]